MFLILGTMIALGGLFIFLWYRTVVSLPVRQQPLFIHPRMFKWGIPLISLVLLAIGFYLVAVFRPWLAAGEAVIAVSLILASQKFDRYSANIRIIHERYQSIRSANPGMEELEILYHTARWRYPGWSHDRIVELVSGKAIQDLILLIMISENKINPISDWELYRSLKIKVARVAGTLAEVAR
jgi:hypothetical protein